MAHPQRERYNLVDQPMTALLTTALYSKALPVIGCLFAFLVLMAIFWVSSRGVSYFYFDPKDFAKLENGGGRKLPLAAPDTTFESHLRNYVDVMKLLVTVAAASIAFGALPQGKTGVLIAKLILAFSILYGVVFSGLLQYFYDEYTQNVQAYTRWRYALIRALGFSALTCFVVGYLVWAFTL
jgi:hypothetical protein